MKRTWYGILCLAVLGLGVSAPLANAQNVPKEKEKMTAALPLCPVMGEPVNLAVSTPTDDGPVFFCCSDCIPKYKANPEKYAAKVAAQRKALADRPKIQVTCPVSGKPVDTKVFVEHDGQKIYFCCKDCISKYEADPQKYAAKLANSYTYQVKCPVSGEKIDPQSFTQLASGQRVYFCCDGCKPKLAANPSKYLAKLEAQGFKFAAKDMKSDDAS